MDGSRERGGPQVGTWPPDGGKVLVTGALGFVGRVLCDRLEAEGWTVARLDLPTDVAEGVPDQDGISHVIHLAARTFVPASWTDPASFYRTNTQGTANVLEFCRRRRASCTYVSTYVYGTPARLPVSEDDPVSALSPYHHSKLLAEDICRFYSREFGVPVVVVRPFNIYGPGQRPPFLVPSLVKQALRDARVEFADGRPRRDYLHVDDLASLLVRIAPQEGFRIYNAGSGCSVSVAEIAELIVGLVERPGLALVSRHEQRRNEVLDLYADINRAAVELGWRPQRGFADGIREVIAEARENGQTD